ncbi:MAG: GAF domain-containing protein [candidate division Zixibacteria bacterium]|nr:GAF domain-containing protein [candidate division Zixibacteria bacterium]
MDNDRRQLVDNIRIAIASAQSENEVLEEAAKLIDSFSDSYNWTGFYMMRGNALEVGPYVGPATEHTRIELNKGICGAAASRGETVMVDDVRSDSRFLACSLSTRSEIVVPLLDGEIVLGEIDIDSDRPHNFTSADREMLETIAQVIVERLSKVR